MRQILKWLGSKATSAVRVSSVFTARSPTPPRVWFEPFAGTAAVALHRAFHRELSDDTALFLADRCAPLVRTHEAIQADVEGVIAQMDALPWGEDFRSRYTELRDHFNGKDGPLKDAEHAALMLWLNRACFNGVWRQNKAGAFNVPVGSYAAIRPPLPALLRATSRVLRHATIAACDFRVAFEAVERLSGWQGAQVYADPPYFPLSATASFSTYDGGRFTDEDQRDLATWLRRAAAGGAVVAVSNHDVPEALACYEGFEIERVPVRRSVSASKGSRGQIQEILACCGQR